MLSGKTYIVTFWLSLSDPCPNTTTGAVGVDFFDSANNNVYSNPINESNVTENGWTKFSFNYTAAGGEDQIRIGGLYTGTSGLFTNPNYFNFCVIPTSPDPSVYYFLDDVSVSEVINISASANPTLSCIGDPVTLTAIGPVGTTYTWLPNNQIGTSVITPALTGNTIYTVSGTDPNGCFNTASVSVTGTACCVNSSTNQIVLTNVTIVPSTTTGIPKFPLTLTGGFAGSNVYTGNIAAPTSGIITGAYTVRRDLTISTPVQFNLTNIAFEEANQVKQNAPTVIDHSYWYGCNKMWIGVATVSDLTISNSVFEDAGTAIGGGNFFGPVITHPGINIINSIFNKNQFGVGMFNVIFSNAGPGPNFRITSSIFTSRNLNAASYNAIFTSGTAVTSIFPSASLSAKPVGFLKGSPILAISNTIRGEAGIIFLNVTATTTPQNLLVSIGDNTFTAAPNSLTNFFDFLNEGVANFNSNIFIKNNLFQNIFVSSTSSSPSLGAIYSSSGHSKIGYYSPKYKNIFTNCTDAIYATGAGTLNVNENDFNRINRYSIEVTKWYAPSPATQSVSITDNKFTDAAYAFYGFDNSSINASIISNTLSNVNPPYNNFYNVFLNEITTSPNAFYDVNLNFFSGSLNGVLALNTYGTDISNNFIVIKKPPFNVFNAGIQLNNTVNCLISNNTIRCNPSNASSAFTNGIITGIASNNTYACNDINRTGACLKFQGACPSTIYRNTLADTSEKVLIGLYLEGNAWTGDVGVPVALTFGASNDIWGNFIIADSYCNNFSNRYNPPSFPVSPAKIYYDNSKPAVSYFPQVNFANGGANPSQAFVPQISITQYNNLANCSNPKKLMRHLSGGNAAFFGTGLDFGTNTQQTVFMGRKGVYDAYKKQAVNTNSITGATAFMNTSASGSIGTFFNIDSLANNYAVTKNVGNLNTAKNLNNTFTPVTGIEQNQKDFNSIYLTYLQADSLVSVNDVNNLRTLAQLCPFTDGTSVYQARALLSRYDTLSYSNACEFNVPNFGGTNRFLAPETALNSSIEAINTKVFPNPAGNELFITTEVENATIEIYNIIGEKIHSQKLENNATKLDISSFNSGTYLYKIIKDNTIIKADKLIINR